MRRTEVLQRIDPHLKSGMDVRRMFDAIAPRYDLLNRCLSAGRDARWRRSAVARALDGFDPAARLRVLDACCGTGDLALEFRRDPRVAQVVGIDFAPVMVAQAARKTRSARSLQLAVADVQHAPLRAETFDVAAIAFGLRNLVDPRAGIREFARLLRPGGRLAVLEFFTPRTGWRARAFRFYFRHVLPRIGRLVTRGAGVDAYRYLPDSVEAFASAAEVEEWLRGAGMRVVRTEWFLAGAVGLVVSERSEVSRSSERTEQAESLCLVQAS